MKQKAIILISFLLVFCFLFSSCRQKEAYGSITVSNETPNYSEETTKKANDVTYSLVYQIAQTSAIITPTVTEKLQTLAEQISNCILSSPIEEPEFLSFLQEIEEKTPSLVSAYSVLQGKTQGEKEAAQEVVAELYQKVLSTFGVTVSAKIAYSYLLVALENEIQSEREKAQACTKEKDTVGAEIHNQRLNQAKADKKAFSGIGEENFVDLMKDAVLVFRLLSETGTGLDATEDFSSMELLLLYREMNFSIELTEEQWKVLIDRLSELSGDVGEFLSIVTKYHHEKEVGEAAQNLLRLLSSLQKLLTEDAVTSIRSGAEGSVNALLSVFEDSETQMVKQILSTSLQGQDYISFLNERTWGQDVLNAEALTYDEYYSLPSGERVQRIFGLLKGIFVC